MSQIPQEKSQSPSPESAQLADLLAYQKKRDHGWNLMIAIAAFIISAAFLIPSLPFLYFLWFVLRG